MSKCDQSIYTSEHVLDLNVLDLNAPLDLSSNMHTV